MGGRPAIARCLVWEVNSRPQQAPVLAAKLMGHALESDTAAWVAGLEPKLANKLARVGLVPARKAAGALTKLGPFLEAFVAQRGDVKAATRVN